MRRILATVSALVAVIVLVACTPEEQTSARLIEEFRVRNGLAQLDWDETLYAKARGWSQHLADEGTLSHSNLADGAPHGWKILGENVAWNTDLEAAIHALEQSPSHRANLLNSRFTRFAVGVIYQDGRYWVTEEFMG